MMDVMQKSSKAGEVLVHFCDDTRCTARACVLLDNHRKLVECSVELEVPSAAKVDVVLTFASEVLSPKSSIDESREIEAAAEVFTNQTGSCLDNNNATILNFSPRMVARKVLLGHYFHLLSILNESYSLYVMCRHIHVRL